MIHPTYNKQFLAQTLERKCEWLTYLGQPMLYDCELYVLRRDPRTMTPTQYYMWFRGIRVA